jgi:hypothetical protein
MLPVWELSLRMEIRRESMEKEKRFTVTTPYTHRVVSHYHEAAAIIEYEWRRFQNAVKREFFHFRAFVTANDGTVEGIFWDGQWGCR